MKKLLLIPFLALSLVLVGCGGTDQVVEDDVIKIGYLGPLTGNAASYGQDGKRAVELYFEQHPEINGKTVEVIYEDSQCSGQQAASAATKLINVDGVKAIIGGQCSGETLGAAPVAKENQVIMLSPVSSSPEITDLDDDDLVFRVYPSDAAIGLTLANLALEYEQVAVVTESTDYAEALRQVAVAKLEAEGKAPVVDETVVPDTTEFKTIVQKIKDEGADVVLSIMQTPVTHGFLTKQLAEMGSEAQVVGTDTMEAQQFFDIAKDAGQKALMVGVAEDPEREGVKEFLEAFGEVQSAKILAIKDYDAVALMAKAIEKVGNDAVEIRGYFRSMDVYEGLGGPISFDENGDLLAGGGSVKHAVEQEDGSYAFELKR